MSSLEEELLARQLAQAGPAALPILKRSAALQDALKSINESVRSGMITRSAAGTGLSLLAEAILKHSQKANDKGLSAAELQDRTSYADALTNAMGGSTAPPVPQVTPDAPIATAPPEPPPIPPQQTPTAPGLGAAWKPDLNGVVNDRRLLAETLKGEAGNQGPVGQQAVLDVINNRQKQTGSTFADVVTAPRQFSSMDPNLSPQMGGQRPKLDAMSDSALAPQFAMLGGSQPQGGVGGPPVLGPDKTHFLNPNALPGAMPAWANGGQGHQIGAHVFSGGPFRQTPPYQPPGQPAQDMSAPAGPGNNVDLAGTPPAQPSPAPAGGAWAQGGGQPQGATPEELNFVRHAYSSGDPRLMQMGEQVAMAAIKRRMGPTQYDFQTVNGVIVAVDKSDPSRHMVVGTPPEAMSKLMSAPEVAQAGITPGSVVSQSPTGVPTIVQAPPQGYQGSPQHQQFTPGGPADPTRGGNQITNEGQLRQQYDREIAPYRLAREGYQKVLRAAHTGTPAGDIALVFGYMKTLDPGSTVREGEQATVQNSGTIDQTLSNLYNRLITGNGRLSPEQRQQFVSAAGQQFSTYETSAQALNERYGKTAQSYGLNPANVVQDFKPVQDIAPPPQQSGVPESAVPQNDFFGRGKPPTQAPRLSVEQAARLAPGTPFVGLDGVERVRK